MYKQVIIVNSGLKIGKGKACAQVAHASLGAYRKAPSLLKKIWEMEGEKKVVLKASLDEMLRIKREAEKRKMKTYLVKDAGKTQLPPGSITALAIGPEKEEKIDPLTSHLKLL